MPDTGAPWNIPYADPTDLVRDWPALSEDVAEAIADGLDVAGGLVKVYVANSTTRFTASLASAASSAVTGMSISDVALSDASNRLVIWSFFGTSQNTGEFGGLGIAVSDGTSLIGIGPVDGTRTRVTAGYVISGDTSQTDVRALSMFTVHSPGDTAARTYSTHVVNISTATCSVFVNRQGDATANAFRASPVSSLLIAEVNV